MRQYVPELVRVPDQYLTQPWTMPTDVQRAAGCEIGRDYPAPIVDHAQARREALARYRMPERDAGLLADCRAPAWVFLTGMKSGLSSTGLRNPDGSWKASLEN